MADQKLIRAIPYSSNKVRRVLLILGGVWLFLFLVGCLAGQGELLKRHDLLFILSFLAVIFILNFAVYLRLRILRKFIEVFDDRISIPLPLSKIVKTIRLVDIKNVSLQKYQSLKRGLSYVLWISTPQTVERLDDLFVDVEDLQWLESFLGTGSEVKIY